MGRSYLFECSRCGYKARVSGGPDRGFRFFVQTILCSDCRELYDAVVRVKTLETGLKWMDGYGRLRRSPHVSEAAPAFESVLNRLPPSGAKSFRWTQFKIRCPVSPVHRVRLWNDPGECPRCATHLEKNTMPYRLWE